MAELADAHGSGPCGSNTMRVQVSFPALQREVPNTLMKLYVQCVGTFLLLVTVYYHESEEFHGEKAYR